MPEDVLEKFVSFLSFMENCSCKEPKWVKSYKYYATQGEMQDKCKTCMTKTNFDNNNCCGGCNL